MISIVVLQYHLIEKRRRMRMDWPRLHIAGATIRSCIQHACPCVRACGNGKHERSPPAISNNIALSTSRCHRHRRGSRPVRLVRKARRELISPIHTAGKAVRPQGGGGEGVARYPDAHTKNSKNILARGDASRARISLYVQSRRVRVRAHLVNDCQYVEWKYNTRRSI